MGTLIIAEHDNTALSTSTLCTVSAASRLENEITLLVAGHRCAAVADAASRVAGVSHVLLADDGCYEHQLAENLAALAVGVASDYGYVLAPSTTFGKNLLPRLAALLGVAQISDIVAIESPETFVRPIYAGNVMATVKSADPVKVITIRASAFDAAPATDGEPADIRQIASAGDTMLSRFVDRESSNSDRPDLASARVVIAGGRGLGNRDNLEIMEQIADRLGAAIGATRAMVDAGLAPNDLQIGQTGKVVAPQLYIAMGISGAIQHVAGMRDSKVIVAINKDAEAPIFEVADYGLVADLTQALPELAAELDKSG